MKQLNWYQIFGKSNIPDGRTVTPTDDIQIWLHCANIWDKTYTTLAEVLADTDTLTALINSNNAVDYMVRSTTWANGGEVPQMTSYTTPSGEVIYSNEYSWKYLAWYAFDRGAHGQWEPSGSAGNYIGYKFDTKVNLYKFSYQGATGSYTSWSMKDFKLQGSNDGEAWTDIQSFTYTSLGNVQTFTLSSLSDAYQYFRLYCVNGNGGTDACATEIQFYYAGIAESSTAMAYIGLNNYCANTLLADATWCEAICNSEYFESVLNVKVPTMTSNTTPSGEASQYGNPYSGYEAYKAFDNNYSTSAQARFTTGQTGYIRYEFPNAVKCFMGQYRFVNPSSSTITFDVKLQRSIDSLTWVDISETEAKTLTAGGTFDSGKIIFSSFETAKYYQLSGYPRSYYAIGAYELQFYGREDV